MEKYSRQVHVSEARKKIDCLQPVENVTWSRTAESLRPGWSKCDLRKSLAWDSAFFTCPGVLDPEELFATLNLREEDFAVDVQRPIKILPSVSLETTEKIRRANECDARRSWAWDSAFFTNPGVLDAEELSLVNTGFSKTDVHKPPELSGEPSKSADLSSAMQGSRYSVTSIEIDLFEDLRASVRKSGTKYDTAFSDVKNEGSRETQLSKGSDSSALRRSKPLLPLGRLTTNVQRQNRIQKERSLSVTQQAKRVVHSGESNPLSYQKPPKVLCRANATSATSLNKTLAPERAKPENSSTLFEIGRNKYHCFQQQPGNSPAQKTPHSTYALSDRSTKSPTSGWRSRTAASRLTASDSSFKTPSRCPNRRFELLSSSKLRFLLSKPSASSPASCSSSTERWSTDSAASLNQRPFSCAASIDTSTGLFDNGSSSCKASDSEAYQSRRKTPIKLTPPSDDAIADVKPTGLRIPLPKIGFFDSENSQKEKKFNSSANAANKRRCKKSKNTFSKESPSPLEQRNPARLHSLQSKPSCDSGREKCSKPEGKSIQGRSKSETGIKITGKNVQRSKRLLCPKEENGLVHEENKENIIGFENRAESLSRDIEVIDLDGDVVIELQTENPRF